MAAHDDNHDTSANLALLQTQYYYFCRPPTALHQTTFQNCRRILNRTLTFPKIIIPTMAYDDMHAYKFTGQTPLYGTSGCGLYEQRNARVAFS